MHFFQVYNFLKRKSHKLKKTRDHRILVKIAQWFAEIPEDKIKEGDWGDVAVSAFFWPASKFHSEKEFKIHVSIAVYNHKHEEIFIKYENEFFPVSRTYFCDRLEYLTEASLFFPMYFKILQESLKSGEDLYTADGAEFEVVIIDNMQE